MILKYGQGESDPTIHDFVEAYISQGIKLPLRDSHKIWQRLSGRVLGHSMASASLPNLHGPQVEVRDVKGGQPRGALCMALNDYDSSSQEHDDPIYTLLQRP